MNKITFTHFEENRIFNKKVSVSINALDITNTQYVIIGQYKESDFYQFSTELLLKNKELKKLLSLRRDYLYTSITVENNDIIYILEVAGLHNKEILKKSFFKRTTKILLDINCRKVCKDKECYIEWF